MYRRNIEQTYTVYTVSSKFVLLLWLIMFSLTFLHRQGGWDCMSFLERCEGAANLSIFLSGGRKTSEDLECSFDRGMLITVTGVWFSGLSDASTHKNPLWEEFSNLKVGYFVLFCFVFAQFFLMLCFLLCFLFSLVLFCLVSHLPGKY